MATLKEVFTEKNVIPLMVENEDIYLLVINMFINIHNTKNKEST